MKKREAFFLHNSFKFATYRNEMIRVFSDFKNGEDIPFGATTKFEDLDFFLFREAHFRWVAGYSLGNSKRALSTFFLREMMEALRKFRNSPHYFQLKFTDPTQYHIALWAISLAILLEVEPQKFDEIVETLYPKSGDRLIDALIAKYKGCEADASLPIHHEYSYNFLVQATQSKGNDQIHQIGEFLKHYFTGLENTSWYNEHIKQDPAFFGYWSFELAAIVKLWDINDISFADNMFYPRDLVKDRLFRVWQDSEQGEKDRGDFQKFKEDQAASELANMKQTLTDFAKSALKSGTENLTEDGKAHLEASEDSFAMLSGLLGIDATALSGGGDEARESLLELFASIAQITETAATAQPDPDLSTEGLKPSPEFASELDALMDKLPRQVRRQLKNQGSAEEIRSRLKKQMGDISRALRELSHEQEMSPEELTQALQKVAADFGIKVDRKIAAPGEVTARTKNEVAEELAQLRKDHKSIDWDFDKMWNED